MLTLEHCHAYVHLISGPNVHLAASTFSCFLEPLTSDLAIDDVFEEKNKGIYLEGGYLECCYLECCYLECCYLECCYLECSYSVINFLVDNVSCWHS